MPRDGDFQMQRMQVAVVGSWPDRCRVRWWAGAVAKSRWECVHESVGPGTQPGAQSTGPGVQLTGLLEGPGNRPGPEAFKGQRLEQK